jgi:hypothetical protein
MRIKPLIKQLIGWILRMGQRLFFKICRNRLLSLHDLLNELNEFEYVVLKSDVPYMPVDFPQHYPLGKDLDLLVLPFDYLSVVSVLDEFAKRSRWKYGVVRNEDGSRMKIRFMWSGILHYQIDCTCDLGGEIEHDLLESREKRGPFFRPEIATELIYRCREYDAAPHKVHHLLYIRAHTRCWDHELAQRHGILLSEYMKDNNT